jgi:sugar O-acyltransferase (sialic acid O-acetyltransferase NeuD family)
MIIVGAGALGLETLGILLDNNYTGDIIFFDDNPQKNNLLIFNKYKVINDENELLNYMQNDRDFIVSIGHPRLREKKYLQMLKLGCNPVNLISKKAILFPFIKPFSGCIIEPFAGISHGVEIGESCAIHINCTIGHEVKMGKFVNVGPGANIVGPCKIGNYVYISVGAVVHPHVIIGDYAFIGSNVVVNRNIAEFETFLG